MPLMSLLVFMVVGGVAMAVMVGLIWFGVRLLSAATDDESEELRDTVERLTFEVDELHHELEARK